MTMIGLAQIALILELVFAAAFPLRRFKAGVAQGVRNFLSPVMVSVERGLYRLCGIDADRQMGWRDYAIAVLVLSAMHFLLLYAMLRLQFYLPFNPQHIAGM